jgi:CRP/FNR family transcriptional regulator, anaerobic regulatory protein
MPEAGHNKVGISCTACPLRKLDCFRPFTAEELRFVAGFKRGELRVGDGAIVLTEGSKAPHLYTVLSGWGYRFKILDDGRRQILNYVMPGDLVGLQGTLMQEMQHSVAAIGPLTLCVFQRDKLNELFQDHPSLAYDLTWIAAREEQILDEHLLSVGRRSAIERASYLLAFLYRRARTVRLLAGSNRLVPITQQHVADTLGLSLVHTNKTLRKLSQRGLVQWLERGCRILDEEGLIHVARWHSSPERPRPFV